MNAHDQLELERTLVMSKTKGAVGPGPKTILLHVQDDSSLDTRLENALSVARACSAHVECLHVTPIDAYVAFDGFGGVFVMSDVIKALDEQESRLRSKVEAKLESEDVAWDYKQVTGNVASQLISHAALADLIVTTREPHRSDFARPTVGLLGDLICRARTPLLIPPENGQPCAPTGSAMIAWDGSYEAANAVRAAIPLLQLASNVHVVQVQEDKVEAFPGTRLLEYLSRHGVHAELTTESVEQGGIDQQLISDRLMTRAQTVNASYLVMGGYNHSRVGEYLFGGVTRSMLAGAPIPIVIAR